MKTKTDNKLSFIELRAKGLSYDKIAKRIKVSKGTLTNWNREFSKEISKLKQDQLEELYSSYYMLKEARIKFLGKTLLKIDKALRSADLSTLAPDKLLDYKLKYMAELKTEKVETKEGSLTRATATPETLLNEFMELLTRVRAGDITNEQAIKENQILSTALKAFETVKLEKKIETLESIIGGRK